MYEIVLFAGENTTIDNLEMADVITVSDYLGKTYHAEITKITTTQAGTTTINKHVIEFKDIMTTN